MRSGKYGEPYEPGDQMKVRFALGRCNDGLSPSAAVACGLSKQFIDGQKKL